MTTSEIGYTDYNTVVLTLLSALFIALSWLPMFQVFESLANDSFGKFYRKNTKIGVPQNSLYTTLLLTPYFVDY